MMFSNLTDFPIGLKGIAKLSDKGVKIVDADRFRDEVIDELCWSAVFARHEAVRDTARWIIWEAANELGAPAASIQDLYTARGQNKYQSVCVPAVNLRGQTYETARAMFRACEELNAGPFIFEIAKSEMGYCEQRPAEFVTGVLAGAIKEGYEGPVYIQGDHFQVNLKKYNEDPVKEMAGVKDLIEEALAAGYYNIDIDTSTLVDLDRKTIKEQQELNYSLGAELTAHIRKLQPEGIMVSVGGEIGEVGGKNSNAEELEAYVDGYNETLAKLAPGATGLSKVSVQTGTSHGGVPLPDGSVAEVNLDFGVLEDLATVCRDKYGISGTVQHGASTLPDEAFHRFKEAQAAEVHLATGFQNIVMDHPIFPDSLKERMYGWLAINTAKERKEGQTDEQFFYKTRKKAWGAFKQETWELEETQMSTIMRELQSKFIFLFDQLGLKDSKHLIKEFTKTVKIKHEIPSIFAQLLSNPQAFGMQHGAAEDEPGAD